MSNSKDICPLCKANLEGEDIPEKDRQYFGTHTKFSRKLGRVENDRLVEWSCPDCGGVWPPKKV